MTTVGFTVVPLEPDGPDRVTDPGSPRGPRRSFSQRAKLGVLAVVLVAVFGIVLVNRAVGDLTPSAELIGSTGPTTPQVQVWRWKAYACGGFDSAAVDSIPLTVATGLTVYLGGALRSVDLDDGAQGPVAPLQPGESESVVDVAGDGTNTFVLLASCSGGSGSERVVTLDPNGDQSGPATPKIDRLLSGGGRVWGVRDGLLPEDQSAVIPLGDGAGEAIALPAGFTPVGAYGDIIVGTRPAVGGAISDEIVLFDTIGKIVTAAIGSRSTSGPADPAVDRSTLTTLLSVDNGFALWSESPCGGTIPCVVHRHNLNTAAAGTLTLTLPTGRSFLPEGTSANGQRLVGRLTRGQAERPLRDEYAGGAAADLAVIDVDKDTINLVPGVQVSPLSVEDVQFAADSPWLVIAVNELRSTRLLAWKTGLPSVLESPATFEETAAWAPSIVLVQT